METRPEIDMNKYHDFHEPQAPVVEQPNDPPARFCGNECRAGYREERISGVQLQSVSMNGQIVSHKTMCARLKLCAYCGSKLEK
jgi:hypothetical protein